MNIGIRWLSEALVLPFAIFCLSTTAFAQTNGTQTERPVLGLVDLGSSTLQQFQEAMKAKGCKYEVKANSVVVAPGCFKLPGKPTVIAESVDASGKVDIAEVKFTRDEDFSATNTYLQALRRTREEVVATQGNLNVGDFLWRNGKTSVLMTLKNHDPYGHIYFATNKAFDQKLADKYPKVSEFSDLGVF